MRVNSAFKGFLNNRRLVSSGVAIVMPAILFIASSFTEHPDRELRVKQVNLMIRQIGHRLLLQAGDSTSRVLPVTEIKEGTFLLEFENGFVFSHDSLMALSQSLLPKAQFPSGYTVTVLDCLKDNIIYGFLVSNTSPDLLPCKGRREPPGCYIIEFSFPDFYKNVEQEKADIGRLTEGRKSVKVDFDEADPKLEEVKTTFGAGIEPTEKVKSAKVDPQETNSKPEEIKPATSDSPLINLIYSGTLVMFGVTLLIVRFGNIFKPAPVQKQNQVTIKESVQELAALGKFLFDVTGQRLLLGSEVISLTDKECKVLELLHKSFGELIPRETLMQEVWINEGVITGRSLDMFVSKLRKKLSSDPELRITNVHGKGYKLEMPGIQIL